MRKKLLCQAETLSEASVLATHQLTYCTISRKTPSTASPVKYHFPSDIINSMKPSSDGFETTEINTVWVKIEAGSASAARVRAKLRSDNATLNCVGSVSAKQGCWSFLKGGFLLDSPSQLSILFFEVYSIYINAQKILLYDPT